MRARSLSAADPISRPRPRQARAPAPLEHRRLPVVHLRGRTMPVPRHRGDGRDRLRPLYRHHLGL